MTNRERIINTVLCKPVDRPPFAFYFDPWEETVEKWKKEGMKCEWNEGYGLDEGFAVVKVNLGYYPAFEFQVIEDKGETQVVRDQFGILMEMNKKNSSIPRYIDYPVKNRESWEKLKKERLNPLDEGRFPSNWNELVKKYNEGDAVVQIGEYPYGVFGTIRDMMGVEEYLVSFYEQPDLIHDMMDYLTDFWLTIYEKVCKVAKVDYIHIWEDMSAKNGSLISPKLFREFMLPNYKKIKAFADSHNIPVIGVDTDGDVSELIPLFMEGGVNLVFPFEVQAGCDVVEYRKKYPDLCIMGGIDKRALAEGKEAIDRELDRIKEMFEYPGYIAAIDHCAHPEISYENYLYYCKRLKEIIGKKE